MPFEGCLSVVKKEKLFDYETCAVIRHPVNKLISWFQYRSRPQLTGKPRYAGDMSFKEFINSHEGDFKKYSDKRYIEHNEKKCSLIFKHEIFIEFLDFFNLHYPNKELCHLNQSEERKISEADKTLAYSELHEEIRWYETIQTQ